MKASVAGSVTPEFQLIPLNNEQLAQQIGLLVFGHRVDHVLDRVRRRPARANLDRLRMAHRPFDQRLDLRRDRGREKRGVPVARTFLDDPPHVGQETHVEHPVRLVEHEELDLIEFGVALPQMIEQSAGRGHDDIDALTQRVVLPAIAHAAVHDRHAQGGEAGQVANRRFDLSSQFPSRFEDQHARSPAGVADALVVGLANNYTGYYTTPEEYDQQHYEGGHTVFGLWSGNLIVQTHTALTSAMAAGTLAPPPAAAPPEGTTDPGTPPSGDGGVAGTLDAGPSPPVERMRTFEIVWHGGLRGQDRPVGAPFLVLERQQADGSWTLVDSDLGFAFVWRETGGEYHARYDVARDFALGTYRVRIVSARYTLTTAPFDVLPSSGLRVRGFTAARIAGGRTRLDFVAQNPPPDPGRDILSRPKSPEGGVLRFRLRQGSRLRPGVLAALWDPLRGTWSVTLPGDQTAASVHLEPGALTDGLDNTSGSQPTVEFAAGQVAPLDWPPDIGPGGGPPPGPGGL